MLGILSLAPLNGCIERTLAITSSPPGALVFLNDEEVGRTPLKRPFLWYGNYDLALRKDGYETVKTTEYVKAPLCQVVPFDLFVELLPIQFKDEQSFSYTMQPLQTADPKKLLRRALELKGQLQPSEHPATRPAAAK